MSVQYPGHQVRPYVEKNQTPSVVASDGPAGAVNAGDAPGPWQGNWGFLALAAEETFQLFKLGLPHQDRLFNRL